MISARQRTNSYRPNFAMPEHMKRETVEIDSTEQVVEINGSYWVSSKNFVGRYFRVVIDESGQWYCSASDERVAARCKALVQAYQIRQAA